MKRLLFSVGIILSLYSCTDFLEVPTSGALTDDELTGCEQVENAVISAYAGIGNDEINRPLSLWNYGNVRADDAYKGGSGATDGEFLHFLEISSPSIGNETWYTDGFWYRNYVAISRANFALKLLNNISEKEMPNKKIRIAEMRFLRGHMHFIQKIVFKMVPYIDESMSPEDIANTSNVALTNDELWQKIADDFQFAYDNLPETQSEVGRANKYAAAAYLAKVFLYKAYRQDEMHNVVSIDKGDMQKVIDLTGIVINSPYRLENDFAYNFLPGSYENGQESLFAVQYSKDDGTTYGRLNMGNALTTPTPGGDFNKPSQNLVNAFKTNNGLPMFDTYSDVEYNEATDKTDPRLFHTVAIPGKPYKYTNVNFRTDQSRNPNMYGYYSSLKENVDPASEYYVKTGPWYANSKNTIVIRYADVLLMRAEALIETGDYQDALPLINQIRNRAKVSTSLIGFASSYVNIQPYEDGVNCTWTQDYARKALRWERRLEFAMEGSRFFDLVRWGVAAETINDYFQREKIVRTYIKDDTHFTAGKDEYFPIPQPQINFSGGLYKQNPGY
ncbi:MAG: RagB/SusD family nutrient uptake outer membrane protein [Paludibacteraceae bacterium]|nr:RagB/SusD family nutrient uptake outer membrane protein [Paludibacteraceae bacterium]HOF99117.1 RagB/SusD family nutrient uptake outer membrane protein [Paludibacteraceae bacterium]HPD59198.1 RagB/SusD family nutrient uptake outer membrane protein [Paludibacteraceae bacterium]HPL76834.1 RagB/SusD family nutrient uptake outer membrane protein [Paludibacteraceae bacterium]HRT78455.1 RagB/SusD family nutrient uptake outer membrane protein [Paludibacteraceae bacterium]